MKFIFNYKCPFKLIRALYDKKHKESYKFSYGFISSQLGYKSRTAFSHIMTGNKRLTNKDIRLLGELFELKGKSYDYFRLLIKKVQATSSEEKLAANKQLQEIAPATEVFLNEKEHHFYADWLNASLRNLLTCGNYTKDDAHKIAERFVKNVDAEDIEKSLNYLLENEFAKENDRGVLKATEKLVRTKTTFGTDELDKYHLDMIKNSLSMMHKVPFRYKEYSTIDFAINLDNFDEIKDQLRVCRQNILDLVTDEKTCDNVFHLNIQLFPITKITQDE